MSKTNIPTYLDGIFHLFFLQDSDGIYPETYLIDSNMDICFEELTVFDKLRNELSSEDRVITIKIRIPQYKKIDSKCVLKINEVYHHVYNAAHFTDKDGFKKSDLTLERYNGSTEVLDE